MLIQNLCCVICLGKLSSATETKENLQSQRCNSVINREEALTWWSTVGQWTSLPSPNRQGVARHRVWAAWLLHLHPLERRGSWLGGRRGRNERGRDEERGNRTRLRLNWPDEKRAGLASLQLSDKQKSETNWERKKTTTKRFRWKGYCCSAASLSRTQVTHLFLLYLIQTLTRKTPEHNAATAMFHCGNAISFGDAQLNRKLSFIKHKVS